MSEFRAGWSTVRIVLMAAAIAMSASSEAVVAADRLDLKRAVRVKLSKVTPALSVDYEYSFPGRTRVHIRNFGIAPASGRFSYVTTDDALVIEDADSGRLLASVRLRETITVAARPPVTEIANETDFPPGFRSYRWRSSQPLSDRANAVLGKYFRYRPFEQDGHTFLVTTFTELRGLPEGIVGVIALLVSFPYDAATGTYDFHIQPLVREGRSHSDELRATTNPVVAHAADAFVDRIVAEIQHWSGS